MNIIIFERSEKKLSPEEEEKKMTYRALLYKVKTDFIITVRPATALFLVPGIYSAIENSVNGGSCYLVSCKFLQMIVL